MRCGSTHFPSMTKSATGAAFAGISVQWGDFSPTILKHPAPVCNVYTAMQPVRRVRFLIRVRPVFLVSRSGNMVIKSGLCLKKTNRHQQTGDNVGEACFYLKIKFPL